MESNNNTISAGRLPDRPEGQDTRDGDDKMSQSSFGGGSHIKVVTNQDLDDNDGLDFDDEIIEDCYGASKDMHVADRIQKKNYGESMGKASNLMEDLGNDMEQQIESDIIRQKKLESQKRGEESLDLDELDNFF